MSITNLQIGDILDAKDYLGIWHLAIVIDEEGPDKMIHFRPFSKANRNEMFQASSVDDAQRIAAAFTMCELNEEPLDQI